LDTSTTLHFSGLSASSLHCRRIPPPRMGAPPPGVSRRESFLKKSTYDISKTDARTYMELTKSTRSRKLHLCPPTFPSALSQRPSAPAHMPRTYRLASISSHADQTDTLTTTASARPSLSKPQLPSSPSNLSIKTMPSASAACAPSKSNSSSRCTSA
jgi:hypothetical protein